MSRFSILMYHLISSPKAKIEEKYACAPQRFEAHIKKLKSSGFNLVSLGDIENHLYHNIPIPEHSIAITLDDGFEDNYQHAYPILSKYQVPATIFLATNYLGSTNQWMIERGFPERTMLKWEQVEVMQLSGLISFGGHTQTHPRLATLNSESAAREIAGCKTTIEEKLNLACRHFAYPYGNFDENIEQIVANSGYSMACSTRSGFNDEKRNPFALHRIEVYGSDSWWKLKQKINFGMNDASLFFPIKYYTSRVVDKLGSNA